jgi:hypothetical protein
MDRVPAGSMYRKRAPVSRSQKFPDPVRHTIRLSPKRDSYKQPKERIRSRITLRLRAFQTKVRRLLHRLSGYSEFSILNQQCCLHFSEFMAE